jgi:hypothetical protein
MTDIPYEEIHNYPLLIPYVVSSILTSLLPLTIISTLYKLGKYSIQQLFYTVLSSSILELSA